MRRILQIGALALSFGCGPTAEPIPVIEIDGGVTDEDVGLPDIFDMFELDGGTEEDVSLCPADTVQCTELTELECGPGQLPSRTACGCECRTWCDKAGGGVPRERPFALFLSEVHADVRMFAPRGGVDVDNLLVDALAGDLDQVVANYASEFDGLCAVGTVTEPGAAQVETRDGRVWITPGTGVIELSEGGMTAVIDLRNLPAGASTRAALDVIAGAVLTEPVDELQWRVRAHTGSVDEYWAPRSIYSTAMETIPAHVWPGGADASRRLILVVEGAIPPVVAEFALALRLSKRALLVGDSVGSSIAESRWVAGRDGGALVRIGELMREAALLPDAVLPDGTVEEIDSLPDEPPEASMTTVSRPLLNLPSDFGEPGVGAAGVATTRAGLLIAHGAVGRLFPYWDEVGTDLDERLLETWELAREVADGDRPGARDVLRRFQEILHDGHGWILDRQRIGGSLPLFLDVVDSEMIVRMSDDPDVEPGETILAIDGQPASEWLDRQLALSSGGTGRFRAHVAARELTSTVAPVELWLRGADGTERVATVEPVVSATPALLQADLGNARAHGWLDDLGASDVMYINADGRRAVSDAAINDALSQAEAEGARALVVDMRGHPAAGGATYDPYSLLQRLVPMSFETPDYGIPIIDPIGSPGWNDTVYEGVLAPLAAPAYDGPVFLLLAPWAVSFAEDFSIMLRQADRVHVVGRRSAGTTGSITGLQLPAEFVFTFTGMHVQYRDGSPFHGIGILPDTEVQPTASGLAAGRDEVLEKAVEIAADL